MKLKRKLEELNLVDDFLFGAVLSYPGIGEKFARRLLETVFGRKLGKLTVIPQKTYYGVDTDQHGARLDVYIEEKEGAEDIAAVYDVEAQNSGVREAKESLPKRMRFYHAKIDGAALKSGESYQLLKTVVVLMIMPYDPFGRGHTVYTVKNCCVELPDMPYEDGARTIFLYTKGMKGKASEELRQMLHYFEHTVRENAKNETLRELHQMVDQVKKDKEVSAEYMLWSEREWLWKAEGIEAGRKEGIEAGRKEGIKEGIKAGRREERKNTEAALKQVEELGKEVARLKAQLAQVKQ